MTREDGNYGTGVEPDQAKALWDPDAFRGHPQVDFTVDELPIAASLALTSTNDSVHRGFHADPLSAPWVWFAGRPLIRRDAPAPWPRDAEGRPLAHILTVDLEAEQRNHREPRFGLLPLPATGIIQLFHDTATYGNPEDGDARAEAWQVRWLPKNGPEDSSVFALQQPPADLGPERASIAEPLNTEVFATIPDSLNLPSEFAGRDRYRRIHDWLEEFPHLRNTMRRVSDDNPHTPWQPQYVPSQPVSRMCGYGFVEGNPDYQARLRAALPAEPDDTYVRLFEINLAQFDHAPVDWFHGLRPLQVWIRASDLARGWFDDVWCQIRTDA